MLRNGQVRFGGRGEQTTARKRGIGGSPLTLLPEADLQKMKGRPPERTESQSPDDENDASVGTTPDTGAMLCDGMVGRPLQPSGRGALPSEGNQGDEWDAYVTLGRTTGTNAGSTLGARAPG